MASRLQVARAVWLQGLVFLAALSTPPSAAAQRIFVGPGSGYWPVIRINTPRVFSNSFENLWAYDGQFQGGVRVATGDVNGDGVLDVITGAGPGGGPHVQVFNGIYPHALLASFFAFDPAFTGGVFVAAGDLNGDGFADIIVSAGAGGGPHVVAFSGLDLSILASFFAYDASFGGGVSVASGDVNGDGFDDIITGAGPGGGPHVTVRSGVDLRYLASFFAFDPTFRGGVFVAAGDIDQDGLSDIVTGAGPGGGPHVEVFRGSDGALIASFFAYDPAFRGGVSVAAGDINGDGTTDIVTGAGPGAGSHVIAFSGRDLTYLASFLAYDCQSDYGCPPPFTGGVWVASYAGLHFATSGNFRFGYQSGYAPSTITALGPGRPSISMSGTLPAGIQLTTNSQSSLSFSGNPASGAGGIYPLTFTATSGLAKPITKQVTLTAYEYPNFTNASAATFKVGSAGSFELTTTSFPRAEEETIALWYPPLPPGDPYEGHPLPPGLTLTDHGDGTATISGTPSGPAGTFIVWFAASGKYLGSFFYAPFPNIMMTITIQP